MACRFSCDQFPIARACGGLRGILVNVWENHKKTVLVVAAGVVLFKIHKAHRDAQRRKKWNSVGKDVVVLHTIGRSTVSPNISPFVVKLETYMRMAGIKYELDTTVPMGPKGKLPWITLNGEDLADSQLIQEFLERKFNKNFSGHLSAEERGIARAFLIMVDEHLFWGLVWWRIIRDPDTRLLSFMKLNGPSWKFLIHLMRRKVRTALYYQGLGRHSEDEFVEIMRQDFEALSNYLGKKSFFMGEEPCEVDCAVFGLLAQCVWASPGSPFASMVQGDFRNLLNYAIRMRNRFYPDWDELLLK